MVKLTPEQLKTRLKFDYQVVMKMRSPIMNVTAYRNTDDLEQRRNPIVSEEDGHLATHYLVDYYIRTLVGADEYSDRTSVKFDLQANGNYPFSWPGCFVTSSRIPWTPHFRENTPICIDHDMWKDSEGEMLLGELLVHVAKLINFDEIPRTKNYGGLNPPAAAYWREKLDRRPLTPNLPYPVLPAMVDNLTQSPTIPSEISDDFQAKSHSGTELFQPRSAVSQPRTPPADTTLFTAKPRAKGLE